jgi:hypothetical protein
MDLLHDTVVGWLVRFVADSGVRCWLFVVARKMCDSQLGDTGARKLNAALLSSVNVVDGIRNF